MKTISLRAFRVAVDTLDEPVQVVKREDGELRTLGTWTPEGMSPPSLAVHLPADFTAGQAVEVINRTGFGQSRPAPKPPRR